MPEQQVSTEMGPGKKVRAHEMAVKRNSPNWPQKAQQKSELWHNDGTSCHSRRQHGKEMVMEFF